MKGINNRQKMIVTPREGREKKTLAFLKIKSNEVAQKRKSEMRKLGFRRRDG